jgi:hypothetical protein
MCSLPWMCSLAAWSWQLVGAGADDGGDLEGGERKTRRRCTRTRREPGVIYFSILSHFIFPTVIYFFFFRVSLVGCGNYFLFSPLIASRIGEWEGEAKFSSHYREDNFTLKIISYSLFSFASFHIYVYMLFLSFTFASRIFFYSLFLFAPFHLLLLQCARCHRRGADGRTKCLSHKKVSILFFLVVFIYCIYVGDKKKLSSACSQFIHVIGKRINTSDFSFTVLIYSSAVFKIPVSIL